MASNSSTSSQLTSDHQQHGGGGGDDSNPGRMLASAVDAEMARYRTLQSELDQLHRDLQVVRGQETETELVAAELAISQKLDESVYKLVGPALIKQDAEEAVQTVQKRLEFIRGEKDSIEAKVSAKERQSDELATKIQSMQASLQQTTAAAVRAIADQHHSGSS